MRGKQLKRSATPDDPANPCTSYLRALSGVAPLLCARCLSLSLRSSSKLSLRHSSLPSSPLSSLLPFCLASLPASAQRASFSGEVQPISARPSADRKQGHRRPAAYRHPPFGRLSTQALQPSMHDWRRP